MEPSDVTIEILRDIRDQVKVTNQRIDALGEHLGQRIDQTNSRIDETNARIDLLTRRVVESEIRTATAITELAGTVREMTSAFRAARELEPRVERCEREIEELKRRGR